MFVPVMGTRCAVLLTLLAALAAVAVPIAFSLRLADEQSRDAVVARTLGYAVDALHRSDETADQANAARTLLAQRGSAHPCSADNLDLMRKLALSSSYLQAVGYVEGDRLVCSSLGSEENLDIGQPDVTAPSGTMVRADVRFPFDANTDYLVLERQGGFAAVVNKELPVDVTVNDSGVSLATFMMPTGLVIASRGAIDPRWVQRAPKGGGTITFEDAGRIVAIASSKQHYIAAIAAMPASNISAATRHAARLLVPVGIIGGLVLALAVLYCGRLQMAMPSVIRGALRRREFFLVYQPIVDLSTGKWVGAEALIRWRRSNGELIRPDLFIPVAEDTGLIGRITQRVLDLVGEEARDLFRHHPRFHLSINLSASDLQTEATVERMRRLAQRLRASHGNLTVEATEHGFLNPAEGSRVVRALRAAGIGIAIDDFGTGYSSLAYLDSFELDYLKIDRSFVSTIDAAAPTSQVVLHIIGIAKSLNLRMIAEGVETDAQADFLRKRGVQFAQGWLFSKPLTMRELMQAMQREGPARVQELRQSA